MINILHIIHGINRGGAETFIYNIIRSLEPTGFRHNFAIQNVSIGHKEIETHCFENKGRIFYITDFRKNLFKHYFDLKNLLKTEHFDIIHIHNNSLINPIPIIVASHFPGKVIIHSHNTLNGGGGQLGKFIHNINSRLFIKKKFIKVACGVDACRWMFGDNKKDAKVIYNAVDLSKFKFSEAKRQDIRDRLNIGKKDFVIGHVGRFLPVKNQLFLIDIFKRLITENHDINAKLLLVGDGAMFEEVRAKTITLGLADKVVFAGSVPNPQDFYSAFDCFVLPSLFEGFAFVAVEAQASGLNVIASTNNTQEINITGGVKFVDLENQDAWINSILSCVNIDNRLEIMNKMKNTPFDIEILKQEMETLYSSL